MTHTLADEFLADIGEDEEEIVQEDGMEVDVDLKDAFLKKEKDQDDVQIETLKYNSVKEFCKLNESEELEQILNRIDQIQKKNNSKPQNGPISDYDLLVEANNITLKIIYEVNTIHRFIKERYRKKFPELESSVLNPLDYARVVQRIGNESDFSKVDLSDILPPAQIMVVTVTATTIFTTNLSEEEMNRILEACELIITLENKRRKIVEYVESRMSSIAPNLTAMVGSSIAAKLMSTAGGLDNLAKMPACNIQVLGTKKKSLAGFSSSTMRPQSFLWETDIIKNECPKEFQLKAVRVLCGKIALAARADQYKGEDYSDTVGRKLLGEVENKIAKWQEPPPPKMPKPLSAPDDTPKKRRGGKRKRAIKERYKMTALREAQNRIPFGLEAQQTFQNTSKTLGMIGLSTGKIRLSAVDKGILKKQKLKGSSTPGTGTTTSLSFTPVQGIELGNPDAAAQKVREANERYFGSGTFTKVTKKTD